jgi:hypothetical protein
MKKLSFIEMESISGGDDMDDFVGGLVPRLAKMPLRLATARWYWLHPMIP